MKPLQLLAVLVTMILCLSAVSWLFQMAAVLPETAKSVPETPPAETSPPADNQDPESGHFKQNPFTVVSGKDVPKVELLQKEYKFGRMGLGKTGHHDFIVKNVGTVPMKLARGPAQCKCTVTGLKQQELAPGEEATLHVAFTPKDAGEFSQKATFWTNDPETPSFDVFVAGEMFPEISVSPLNGWPLGPFSNSDDIPLTGSLESPIFEKFNIPEITFSSDKIDMQAIPFTEEELKEKGLLSGYHLQGRLKGIDTPMAIKETVTIHTDLADYPKFELPVTGSRTGALTIIGPNWFAGGPLLDMGNVSSQKGKEVKLTVMINPGPEEMKLTEVTTNPHFVNVRLKPEQTGKELARERYSLFVTVPPESAKGFWTASSPGRLILKTNHPLVPELDIKLHMNLE